MKFKPRLLIPSLIVAGLLLVGTVGVVAAQSTTTTPTPTATATPEKPKDKILERAAEILGTTPDKLQSAFEQATKETIRPAQDAAVKAKLDAMVKAGKLSQADADALYTWFQARPDAAIGLGHGLIMGGHGSMGFGKGPMHGHRGPGHGFMMPPQKPAAPSGSTTPTSLQTF